jgi:hypothetical protein
MKNRIDYWTDGTRHPVRLSDYALGLIANHPDGRSQAITEALALWFRQVDHMAATNSFIDQHDGMNLSLLVEIAISRAFDR